jgi:hypothetical protein
MAGFGTRAALTAIGIYTSCGSYSVAEEPLVKRNSECWGSERDQDISCRALTENFLMSLRGATRAEVLKAMSVQGREIKPGDINDLPGLHFVSNYARGARWGSGDVNFWFDEQGRVSIIAASLTAPMAASNYDFLWNAKSLPLGCSDLPRSSMKHCN